MLISLPTDILGPASTIVSVHKGYVKITPVIIDATLLNHNTIFNDRRENSLKSKTINKQETLNRTKNLTQKDIQTPSHFINKEIVETRPKTTIQNFSPIRPTLTKLHKKNIDNYSISRKTICCPKIITYGLPSILSKKQQNTTIKQAKAFK